MIKTKRLDARKRKDTLKISYLLIGSFVLSLMGFLKINSLIYMGSSLLIHLVALFIDPFLPMCISVALPVHAISVNSMFSLGVRFIALIPALYTWYRKKKYISANEFLAIYLSATVLVLSYVFGTNSNPATALIQFTCILAFFVFSQMDVFKNNALLSYAFILVGLYTSAIVTIQLLRGEAEFLYGTRLTYMGNVRALATALAFPIFYLCLKLMFNNGGIKFSQKLLWIVLLSLEFSLLMMTYSRGVIFTIVITLAVVFVGKFHNLTYQRFLILIICAFSLVIVLSQKIDFAQLLYGVSDASGRFDIWNFFFAKMNEKGIDGWLFGLGPGDITRISSGTEFDGYYSHSVIFDYIFAYGFFGFLILALMIGITFKNAWRSKKFELVSLAFMTVALFLTHGNAVSLDFHLMLALVNGTAKSSNLYSKELALA
ncbi:MAG: hypothetical protein IJY01_04650 [Clostridia bacterium]|nr:hypothetical protein [Clostridia bacterium]